MGKRCPLCVWGTEQQMPLKNMTLLPTLRQVYQEIKMRAGCCMIQDRERYSEKSICLWVEPISLSDVIRDSDGK